MKRNIIIITNSLSAFLILTQFGIWNALVMFVLVGAIPGTTASISPLAMLAFLTVAIGGCAFIFTTNTDAKKPIKKSLPKKRYSRI
jgi:hypothetical protein